MIRSFAKIRWPLVRRSRMLEALRLADTRIVDREAVIAVLRERNALLSAGLARPLPCPAVAPFWLGLPNEALTLVVHAGAPALTATIGGTGRDDGGDDPRSNPSLPFAPRPLA